MARAPPPFIFLAPPLHTPTGRPKPSNPWPSARKREGDGEREWRPATEGRPATQARPAAQARGGGDGMKPAATPPAWWLPVSGGVLRRLKVMAEGTAEVQRRRRRGQTAVAVA